MKQADRLLMLLREGPGTSAELATESGLPLRQVSALLSKLHKRHKLLRSPKPVKRPLGPGAYLYRIIPEAPKRPYRQWKSSEVAKLAEMDGKPAKDAAKALGRSLASVMVRAAIDGVRLIRQKQQRRWPEASKRTARKMKSQGYRVSQIAATMGASKASVAKWVAK